MTAVLSLTACSSNDTSSSTEEGKQISDPKQSEPAVIEINVVEFKERLKADDKSPFVLDVRNKEHFSETHLEGSINIPFAEVSERINELPTNQEIVVVCYTGKSAKSTAKDLIVLGYNPVVLEGGFDAINNVAETFQLVN